MSRVDVLIASSEPTMLRSLREVLGADLSANVDGLRIVAKTVGFGGIAAAAGAAKRLARLSPRIMVQVGEAQLLPEQSAFNAADVMVAHTIQLVDFAELAKNSEFLGPMRTSHALSDPLHYEIALTDQSPFGVHRGSIASPLATVRGLSHGRLLREAGHHAVNLESFGMAYASELFDVRFASILSLTSVVGHGNSNAELRRTASQRCTQTFVQWVRRGAPGLASR